MRQTSFSEWLALNGCEYPPEPLDKDYSDLEELEEDAGLPKNALARREAQDLVYSFALVRTFDAYRDYIRQGDENEEEA